MKIDTLIKQASSTLEAIMQQFPAEESEEQAWETAARKWDEDQQNPLAAEAKARAASRMMEKGGQWKQMGYELEAMPNVEAYPIGDQFTLVNAYLRGLKARKAEAA